MFSHSRSGGCLLCMGVILVSLMSMCRNHPVFRFYIGGICKIYMFIHSVYFIKGCAAAAEATEWWSWLDLKEIRGLL